MPSTTWKNHIDLGSARRVPSGTGLQYQALGEIAFEELMAQSVLNLAEEDEQDLGWKAYRILPVHAPNCYSNQYCGRSWEEQWVAASGPLGSLLRDQLSGKELHDQLHDLSIPGMEPECRQMTVRMMQETPTEKSLLKAEENYIEDAVQGLISQW
ncbi:hypothetical protein B0H14DRAFT_2592966 [Mycena olivaceomarginata]|nr:hypothetical protein B0H14DRAFT_2592966 [Mycena olivaceomarginata]